MNIIYLGGEIIFVEQRKIRKLYDTFLNYSYSDLMDLFKKAKTKEEQDFYVMFSNLVLKREAKKV